MPSIAIRYAARLLTLMVFAAAALGAQTFGRITLVVTDESEQPLAGVQVVMTNEQKSNFREEVKTNKKGRVNIAVVDATQEYELMISHEGYETLKTRVKPEIGGTTLRNYKLRSLEAAQAANAARGAQAEQAAPAEQAVKRLSPAEQLFNDGVQALRENDIAGGKAKIQEALDRNPDLAPAHAALAGIYLQEGDHQAALASADRLVALEPQNPRGYVIRYDAYTALGQEQEAKAALTTLRGLGGGDAAALFYNEGVAALRAGDRATAKTSFEQAVELDPELVPAIAVLAAMAMDEKRYADAAAGAERALALDAGDKRALQVRYDAYKALGDEAKAAEAFEALVGADPEGIFDDLYKRGIEAFNAGDAKAARELLSQALAVRAEHAKAHYHLALACTNLGESAAAKEHLERFLALAPDDPDAAAARDMLQYLE